MIKWAFSLVLLLAADGTAIVAGKINLASKYSEKGSMTARRDLFSGQANRRAPHAALWHVGKSYQPALTLGSLSKVE
jgi:hypothetical protein